MLHILCGGCDGWWRKMVLTVLQVVFVNIYFRCYMGYVYGSKCKRRCLFSSLLFERISDFYLVGCFVMGRL